MMKLAMNDNELQRQIDSLSKEIKPQRDLWVGIEHALEHQSQRGAPIWQRKTSWAAMAASFVAAILLSIQMVGPGKVTEPGIAGVVEVMNQQFQQQRQTLLVSYGQPNLSDLPAPMQEQLNQLASARASLEQAISDDPDNTDLVNLLTWLQQQELQLLEQLYSPKWQTL